MKPPLWIKICGVTSPSQALDIAAAGASAIGINLVPSSSRRVSPELAASISAELGAHHPAVERVALFADSLLDAEALSELAAEIGATSIQLHGHEPPELARALDELGWPVIRAIRLAAELEPERAAELVRSTRVAVGTSVRLLVDASVGSALGGTGHRLPADLLDAVLATERVIVAGGLDPGNVAAVVRRAASVPRVGTGLAGVDVASGVEDNPGCKNMDAVRRFIHLARADGL